MDCPQCGAEVPSDDTFCGKCGYARRDDAPERLDQSRIRMHEEREPTSQPASKQRIRKHTVLGMPTVPDAPPAETSEPASVPPASLTPAAPVTPPPPPPTQLSSARKRTPQRTMLGIPRPEFPIPTPIASPDEPIEAEESQDLATESGVAPDPSTPSRRTRARVRYDSANEPFPAVERRRKALRGLAVLVVLAAVWLGYRFFTLNA